jgi:hypothetical protein
VVIGRDELALPSDRDGHDLLLQAAVLRGLAGAGLAAQRVLVLLLARDLVLACEVVRGLGHVEAGIGVEQRDHERVFHRLLTEAQALARTAHDERRLRHVLHAAGQDGAGLVELDLLGGVDDRLDARAAEAVHRECGDVFRDACLETDVARAVDRVARGLQGVADDHMVHLLGREAAAGDRLFRRDDPEVDRADVIEVSVVLRHRRASAVDDHDFFQACSFDCLR